MFQGATMKKLFVSSAVALALSCGALVAEESGAFVGVGLGVSGTKIKDNFILQGTTPIPTADYTYNASGFGYELLFGYKQFFTPEFGLRYYANFAGANTSATIEGTDETAKLNVMNYGVNVDALYNFINDDSLSFGAFLGLGLGMNSWSGNAIDGFSDVFDEKAKKSGFSLALNLGVRTEIAKHHGVELAAKVPFLATTLFDKEGAKVTAQQTYNVGARYIFSF